MNSVATTWDDLARRETVDPAMRIFGMWSAVATPFYVFVVRPGDGGTARIDAARQALARTDIGAVIPPKFLHITVQSLGNVGEGGLTDEIAAELGDAVAETVAGIPPFAVRLRGVGSFGSAAFVAVHEDDAALPLHAMQRRVVETLLAAGRVPVRHPERPYLPHLSFCYYDRPYPAAAVIEALAPYRQMDCGFLHVQGIDLVKIAGDGTHYPPMETVRRIAFGGGA